MSRPGEEDHDRAHRRREDEAVRTKAIADVAEWITSSMASGMFGSDTYGLRRRLAEVVRGREWETTLKEQTLRL